MAAKLLKCFCDHCVNQTCITSQLCYAEWKPLSQEDHSPSSSISPHSRSSSLSQTDIALEKSFNCFTKDDPLLIKTICNVTATNTSHIIRKCCNHGDYCNKESGLLPNETAARNVLKQFQPQPIGFNQHGSHEQGSLSDVYHGSPKVSIIFFLLYAASLVIFILFTIYMLYHSFRLRRRYAKRSPSTISRNDPNDTVDANNNATTAPTNMSPGRELYSFKGVLNRLLLDLGFGKRSKRSIGSKNGITELSTHERTVSGVGGESRLGHPSISANLMRSKYCEEFSENSARANHDAVGYDTNSMASHEPLLRSNKRRPESPMTLMQGQPQGSAAYRENTEGKPPPSTIQTTLGSVNDTSLLESSSGSGAGQPYLTQRSISHDIQLVEVVGRGFFGVVWRGEYKGEPVAVKIFSPIAEPSWERETDIYQTTMMRHKNILGFIATDKRQDALLSGYWLVTDYYPMGSLYDFLRENSMSMSDALRMAFSIANGLSHLHIEIYGTKGKPAIAHRDLKSKNILVKNDGTCCIADLGMAVRYNSTTVVDLPTNSRIGTRRYLAPEILDHKLNLHDFDSVKATDIYALGLVLWEVLCKTCLLPTSARRESDFPLCIEKQYIARALPGAIPDLTPAQNIQSKSPIPVTLRSIRQFPSISKELKNSKNIESGPRTPMLSEQHLQTTSEVASQQQTSDQFNQCLPSTNQSQVSAISSDSPLIRGPTLEEAINEIAFICDQYEPPYHQYVSPDPSMEEMFQVVCVRKLRPDLMLRWDIFSSMREFVTVMTECWYEKPQARLSALRVRKSLSEIAKKYYNLNMEYD